MPERIRLELGSRFNRHWRVLLVEDHREVATVTVEFLQLYLDAEYVANYRGACQRLTQEPKIDVVLLDMVLENGAGLELIHSFKADKKRAATPLIVLTGYAYDRSEVLAAGADDYLEKPMDSQETLIKAIQRQLQVVHRVRSSEEGRDVKDQSEQLARIDRRLCDNIRRTANVLGEDSEEVTPLPVGNH